MPGAFAPSWSFPLGDDVVQVRCSTIADGDFHIEAPRAALLHRRAAFDSGVWTQLDEVHGTTVHEVAFPGQHDFEVGDALCTRRRGAVLSTWVGDCAPVVLWGADGVIGAAHAGWSGALHGVLPATVAAMGDSNVRAALGPCIHPCCYQFGPADLDAFADRFGQAVRGTTSSGAPALDMRAVVRISLAEVGVELDDRSLCTGCHPALFFSHRVRQQVGRQVMTISKRRAT